MKLLISILFGLFLGFTIRKLVNWLSINNYKIHQKNPILEVTNIIGSIWAFHQLQSIEAFIFCMLVALLCGISIVDYNTYEIPMLFTGFGFLIAASRVVFNFSTLSAAFWGIFVGAILPLAIIGLLWMITKRQGMGFGDIHLGLVLGTWLGPMRMSITLFIASSMSLLVWIFVSLLRGFDKDRALPFGPFLSIGGTGVYVGSFYYPDFFYLLMLQ